MTMNIAMAVFSLIAAGLWAMASFVKGPSGLTQAQVAAVKGDIIPMLDQLMKAVTRQSKLNATAAFWAALARACQVASLVWPHSA
jgi:hypothetical protein